MGWDGNGNVVRRDGTRTGSSVFELAREADVLVNAPDHDTHDNEIATAIENCVARDGQNQPTLNLPMGGKKHTGVGDAVSESDYAAYGQLLALVSPFVSAANIGGTGDAVTLTPPIAATSYVTGKGFSFFSELANTGAITVTVSNLAAVSVKRADGTDFDNGDIKAGRYVRIIYNGANFHSNIPPPVPDVTDFAPFDLDEDVTRAITSLSDADGFVVADKSTTGFPNRVIQAQDIADYMQVEVDLDADRVTGGTLNVNRIPNIPASKTSSGTFNVLRIPNLAASKITSGIFNVNRVASVLTQTAYNALTPDANTLYLITG